MTRERGDVGGTYSLRWTLETPKQSSPLRLGLHIIDRLQPRQHGIAGGRELVSETTRGRAVLLERAVTRPEVEK